MVVVNKMESSRDKVRRLLRELFQFDAQDLDFGIYRILNFRRKEIERFIEKDLIEAVEAEFKEYAKAGMVELQREVDRLKTEIIRDFGEGTIDAQGRAVRYEDAKKVQEYVKKVEELKSAEVSEAQMNEVFNHVYEFFSRYYDKGDFISKRRYGGKEKYYVPYNGEEVVLHWANKDQYYVKTAEYFRNYHFKAGGYRVNFLLREAEVEVNNVVGENKYFVLCDSDFVKVDEEKRVVDIYFEWRALTDEEERKFGTRNVQDLLVVDAIDRIFSETSGSSVGSLLRVKENGEKTVLEKHLNNYVTRNTTDYFIHKNLNAFLERELEFYIKNEVVDLDELESLDERSLHIARAKVKAIREISRKIIEFLAQIEDFQRMLFEKKKLILRADYCITLDLISEKFYEEIGKNERQVAEWKELLRLDEITKGTLYSTVGKKTLDVDFLKAHKHLMLDTMFFNQEFKHKIIESFESLDQKIGGIIIKSENFQALNLLLEKYNRKIECIYIDPPFNTGVTQILYKNDYKDSSWLTLMENRFLQSKSLLHEDGVLVVAIDDYELSHLCELVDKLFNQHERNMVVVNHHPQGGYGANVTRTHEYALFIIPRGKEILKGLTKESSTEYRPFMRSGRGENNFRYGRPNSFFAILVDPSNSEIKGIEPPPDINQEYPKEKTKEGWLRIYPLGRDGAERVWRLSYQGALVAFREGMLACRNAKTLYQVIKHQERRAPVFSNWTDKRYNAGTYGTNLIADIMGDASVFPYPKSLYTVQDTIEAITHSNKQAYILDYFAGSGTTAHATLNLNKKDGGERKYILVEMDDYFDTVLKQRIEKIVYSRKWRDGKPVSKDGHSHMFKYIYLEQYEDALNNIAFIEKDKTIQETLESFQDYLMRYMLDYETRDSPTRLSMEQFQTPFDYKIWVTSSGEKKLVTVDLVETFNYLLGITVEKFRIFKDNDREYRVVFGKKKDDNIAIIWRNSKDIDLKKDKEFIENTILAGTKPDRIFTNGDSIVEKAEPIEPEFKRLMGA